MKAKSPTWRNFHHFFILPSCRSACWSVSLLVGQPIFITFFASCWSVGWSVSRSFGYLHVHVHLYHLFCLYVCLSAYEGIFITSLHCCLHHQQFCLHRQTDWHEGKMADRGNGNALMKAFSSLHLHFSFMLAVCCLSAFNEGIFITPLFIGLKNFFFFFSYFKIRITQLNKICLKYRLPIFWLISAKVSFNICHITKISTFRS